MKIKYRNILIILILIVSIINIYFLFWGSNENPLNDINISEYNIVDAQVLKNQDTEVELIRDFTNDAEVLSVYNIFENSKMEQINNFEDADVYYTFYIRLTEQIDESFQTYFISIDRLSKEEPDKLFITSSVPGFNDGYYQIEESEIYSQLINSLD